VTAVSLRRLGAPRTHHGLGLLAVIFGVLGLSLGSTIVKKSAASGLSIAVWRLIFGSAIWLVVLHARRGRLSVRAVRTAGPAAVFFAGDLALFFVAVTHTSVANAEFIGSLTPVVVVPLAALIFRERLHWRSLMWGAAALVGVGIVLFNAAPEGASSVGGDLLAIAAMCTWSGYLLTARGARAGLGATEFMTTVAILGASILIPISAIAGQLWSVPASAWKYIAFLALFTGTICHGLLAWAQTRVPVSTISILQVANPALASLWAFLVLDETVNGVQAIGMVMVVGALAAFTVSSRPGTAQLMEDEDLGGPSG